MTRTLAPTPAGAGMPEAGGRDLTGRVAAATPATRDRYADFLRVSSMLVVVLGHWLMTAVAWDGDMLAGTNILALTPGLWLATWVFQVMPLFFFVGGFANLRGVESVRRRGGGAAEFLAVRAGRLLRPTAVFAGVWLVLLLALPLAGAPEGPLGLVGGLLPQPLWFLATYLGVTALAPVMVRLHRRFGVRVLAGLGAAAALVDAARFTLDLPDLGYLNLALVWLGVHQLGFFYADGTLARCSRRALLGMAAAGLSTLILLVVSGAYPPSMVTLPGATESNMNPPTVCMLALTVWQVALVMLARPRMTGWLAGGRTWAAVVTAGSMAMSVFLWHMTALVGLLAVVVTARLPLPAPGTAAWWLSRPLWLAALAVLLVPLLLAFHRFERPPAARPEAPATARGGGLLAASLGVVCAVLGIFGFVTGGFSPLPDPGGSPLLLLRVDPVQSAAWLALGMLLLRAARTGAAAAPAVWWGAAAASAALLLPTLPAAAGTPLQIIAATPANAVLHGTTFAVAVGAAFAARARSITTRRR